MGRGEDKGEELNVNGLLVVISCSISLNSTFHGVLFSFNLSGLDRSLFNIYVM